MVVGKKLVLVTLVMANLGAGTAFGQSAITRSEPISTVDTATYLTNCSTTLNSTSIATSTRECAQIVSGLLRMWTGSSWTPLFNASGNLGGLNSNTLTVVSYAGANANLNLTTPTLIVAATNRRVFKISVIVAGTTTGTVNDTTTTGAAAVANQVFTIPNTVGVYDLNWPMTSGIVIVPGTGQTVAVSYN